MTIPFTFANQSGPIPLSELDADFLYALNNPGGGVGSGSTSVVPATKYFTDAQLAGINGTGPLVDVSDALDQAIADVGDITWQGSMLAQRPSAGGMKAGGVVVFAPGVYMISRTIYRPPHVTFYSSAAAGGFFYPRANDASTANGNVKNVTGPLILANFPAGTGVGQAGQMWVIDTANWVYEAGPSHRRPRFNECFTGAQVDDETLSVQTKSPSKVPGGGVIGLNIDSVRDPATGLHVANQIPYGAIRGIAALNSRHEKIGYSGVDFGICINASWGYSIRDIFGYSFLGGLWEVLDVNASSKDNVYTIRDSTLDATAPRSITNSNRLDCLAVGALAANTNGLPEDFTNMRFGHFLMYPSGSNDGSITCETWDVNFFINQAPYAGVCMGTMYGEGATVAPFGAVAFLGSINGLLEGSQSSRYGYCFGLNNSFTASGILPRRIHCRPTSEDPNRNIRINVANADLYLNRLGGRSANMLTYSRDCTQGVTLSNMTTAIYQDSDEFGEYKAGKLTASAAAVSSMKKTSATIGGATVDLVNYSSSIYCHWADLKFDAGGTGATTAAIDIAFSGGSGGTGTAKAVITWAAGVPTIVVTGTGATGNVESLGVGWYRISLAADRGTNTGATVGVYLGDGTNAAVNGSTMFIGEHEFNPTLFPLTPIPNATNTAPKGGVWDGYAGGEHWEFHEGITYVGDNQRVIRVSASGYPYALGYDTGNVNTGSFMTLDAALKRCSLDTRQAWEIKILDGDTVYQTANNTSVVQRNPDIFFTQTGAGSKPTIVVKKAPSGAASYMLVEGKFDIQLVGANLTIESGLTDANSAGWLYFRANRGADGHLHIDGVTVDLGDKGALMQQGPNTVNLISLTLGNTATVTGSSTARIHSKEATPGNSETKYFHTAQGATLSGVIVSSASANGWDGTVTAVSTT